MAPFVVTFAPYAAAQIQDLVAQATKSPGSAHEARWKAIKRILAELLPGHAGDPQYAKKNNLNGIRATHAGRRDRVVWIASPEKNKVVVLMIGFVKEGDRADTYEELSHLLQRGTFVPQFEELGIEPPPG